MKNSIVLCADDYGQAPPIDEGILKLCAMRRLSAVSCLVTLPNWHYASKALRAYQGKIDIGLHFNLTHGEHLATDLPVRSLKRLMLKAFLLRLDQKAIEAEWHAQIDLFEAAMGSLPDFIDGHQHVHQFPVIRQAMLGVYEKRLRGVGSYIRLSCFPYRAGFKANVINLTGGYAAKSAFHTAKIPCNRSFAGAYDFARADDYPVYFKSFLAQVSRGGLIMCHPGDVSIDDELCHSRRKELAYFASDQFLTDCSHENVIISRFQEAFIV